MRMSRGLEKKSQSKLALLQVVYCQGDFNLLKARRMGAEAVQLLKLIDHGSRNSCCPLLHICNAEDGVSLPCSLAQISRALVGASERLVPDLLTGADTSEAFAVRLLLPVHVVPATCGVFVVSVSL